MWSALLAKRAQKCQDIFFNNFFTEDLKPPAFAIRLRDATTARSYGVAGEWTRMDTNRQCTAVAACRRPRLLGA